MQQQLINSYISTMMLSWVLACLLIALGHTSALPTMKDTKSGTKIKTEANLHDVEKRAVASNSCLSTLYVMAFTSGAEYAQSGGATANHAVEILVRGNVRHLQLYDRPGEDQQLHKGDLWKFNFTSFHFPDQCIKIKDIEKVYMIENNNDGWNIDSVVTFVRDSSGGVQVLTQNLDVNRWIDGDAHTSHRRYQLTLAL